MKIIINGNEEYIEQKELFITDLLKLKQVKLPDMVSVEVNDQFLDRGAFASTKVENGDRVEFLYFMSGGEVNPVAL